MDDNTIYIELDDEFIEENEVIEVSEKEKTIEEVIEEKVEEKIKEVIPKDWEQWPPWKDGKPQQKQS